MIKATAERPLRVAVNAWHYLPETLGGGETYLLNLLRELSRCPGEVALTVLSTPWNDKQFRSLGIDTTCSGIPAQSRLLRVAAEQLLLSRVCRRLGVDVLHTSANVAPLFHRIPVVLTIHDLNFQAYPNRAQVLYYRTFIPMSAKRCSQIITVSNASRSQIVARCRVPSSKVRVICEAPDPAFREHGSREAAASRVRSRLGLSGDYLLYVGSGKPHKNLKSLFRTVAVLNEQQACVSLVLAGDLRPEVDDIVNEMEQLGVRQSVYLTGRVDQEFLIDLYRGASVFVFPSTHEGFGLPLVEAMASGTPVVSSDRSCLPETCGKGAMLVDPMDVSAFSGAICRLLTDAELRQDLIRRGRERAAELSWGRAAQETIGVYRTAVGLSARAAAGA